MVIITAVQRSSSSSRSAAAASTPCNVMALMGLGLEGEEKKEWIRPTRIAHFFPPRRVYSLHFPGRNWKLEKEETEIEENLPLSELAQKMKSDSHPVPSEPMSVPVKRPRIRSDSQQTSDDEVRSPPGKIIRHDVSDLESDSSITDDSIGNDDIGACVQITNPSVNVTASSKKELLLSQLMQDMRAHSNIMAQMMTEISKLS